MRRIAFVHLVAPESPRQAFYALALFKAPQGYQVSKESGIGQTVLDRRVWSFEDIEDAFRFYHRRLKSKLRSERKSPRRYLLAD